MSLHTVMIILLVLQVYVNEMDIIHNVAVQVFSAHVLFHTMLIRYNAQNIL